MSIELLNLQYGVPTNELAGDCIEADPKSANLTVPLSVNRILPAKEMKRFINITRIKKRSNYS